MRFCLKRFHAVNANKMLSLAHLKIKKKIKNNITQQLLWAAKFRIKACFSQFLADLFFNASNQNHDKNICTTPVCALPTRVSQILLLEMYTKIAINCHDTCCYLISLVQLQPLFRISAFCIFYYCDISCSCVWQLAFYRNEMNEWMYIQQPE